MRRSSALLATTALTAALLAVPTTAQADATGVSLTVDFDRLAKDRVVKLTLGAKSASGVTGVRAVLRYQRSDAEPYATVELTRTAGTDNDGVWQADYRPDIEARPGLTLVEVLITTADGAAYTRSNGFYDCYTTSITDFTSSPAAIDIEHSEVTMRGRVVVQKYREAAPEPAPGVTVSNSPDETTTDSDGSFALTSSGDDAPGASVLRQGQFCATYQPASVTVNKQATQITATMTPASTVAPYTQMDVDGKVVRQGSTGPVPVAGLWVHVNVPSGLEDHGGPSSVQTGADGTFHAFFTAAREAGKSGAVTVEAPGTGFLTGSQADLGTLNIRNISRFTAFNAFPEPLAYGDSIVVNGQLAVEPDFTNSTGLPVVLEFSPDGKTWKTVQTDTLDRPGEFHFNDPTPIKKDGYWRARYAGSPLNTAAVSTADYVDVKYRTQWYNFNASPEPVKKGATITVKGQLYRFRDTAGPGPHAPVYVYFKRAGTTTYTQVATATTDSNGWFKKTFKASVDGTWMAVYKETSGYLKSTSQGDFVDVK